MSKCSTRIYFGLAAATQQKPESEFAPGSDLERANDFGDPGYHHHDADHRVAKVGRGLCWSLRPSTRIHCRVAHAAFGVPKGKKPTPPILGPR